MRAWLPGGKQFLAALAAVGLIAVENSLLAQGASDLRVVLTQATPVWQLAVNTTGATPLSAERAAQIEVLSSSSVATPLSAWSVIEGERRIEGGVLRVSQQPAVPPDRLFFAARESAPPPVRVRDASGLRAAVAAARPGTTILLAPGTYPGGFSFAGLRGAPGAPVVLAGENPDQPPLLQGGSNGIQLTDPSHVELRDLEIRGATGNGLNIDDGGSFDTPAEHVTLRRLRITEIGPTGNRDGIKLSGVVSFTVEGCVVERWGSSGSAVDMVGCHDGLIVSNVFRHTEAVAGESGSGVQAKGGSSRITIRRNRFDSAGARAVNLGGSTGLEFFRPPLVPGAEHWEARDLRVEGNTFRGSSSPIAFVGVDGADVRFNTIYRPQRWAIRILQETTAPGFVPCRNGRFTDNLVVFVSFQWSAGGVNLGANTEPRTFSFARNWWYCVDAPARSRPTLPVSETEGVYGTPVEFRDADAGDLRLVPGSPASRAGAQALP